MYNDEDELFGEPVQQEVNDQDNQQDNQQNDDDFLHSYHYNFEEDENEIFGEENNDNGEQHDNKVTEEEGDFMSKYLKRKKVDKSKIRILNQDTQEEEEVDFDTLSDDEKIALLEMINQPMLSDAEIDAINFMRQHKLADLNTYAESIKQQVIKELGESPKTSSIKNISDDDLFKFDLIDRYGFDEEKDADEIEAILEKEKENESLFNRKITALRKEYEELEENQRLAEQQEVEAEQQKQWEELKDNLIQVAQNTELLHGLELDNQDKNEVLSFVLDRDEVTGESEFIKKYNDPAMLFKMAWYALKGEEAFKTIEDYYKGKLAEARRENKQQSQQQNQTVNRRQLLNK